MTEHEIQQRVERMIWHLDNLLMARNISEPDYDSALRDLSEWEEKAMTELEAERRAMTDDEIQATET